MRFIANGPSIPDDLLIARDLGDVIFFCGAGVSQANAGLPNFERLGREVIRILGAAKDSSARKLLEKAIDMGQMAGVGGLLATDRVFGLLEREFEIADVRAAVAEAIRPPLDYRLDAHRILLNLATSRAGVTRLVTTNFDLLFEECDPILPCSGPPNLPDPRSDRDFRGIVHLHGRVDANYRCPQDDEFVVSSADFGRAYLSDGWATRFIQSLLARFLIVFVGYTADDPPVQYLLEALNLRAGSRNRLFAFQAGETGEAAALWEHRGVQAIPFDSSNGFGPLWDTLAAWAHRARDVDGWYGDILSRARSGPAALDTQVRGQIAHLIATREGAHRISTAAVPIDASWLLAFDAKHRYGTPDRVDLDDEASEFLDPFERLHFDFDTPPKPMPPGDRYHQREAPENSWDPFAPTRLDYEEADKIAIGAVRGGAAGASASLAPRLASVGIWIERVAHMPATLWWAAQQTGLHPDIKRSIASSLRYDRERFPKGILRGWRLLFAAWEDGRPHPDMQRHEIEVRVQQEGWNHSLVREFAGLYRPRLMVKEASGNRHPLYWTDGAAPENVINADIDYPCPHEGLYIPDEHVAYAIGLFRANLELAISLEKEISGTDRLYFATTRAPTGGPELADDGYGLTGPIVVFQKLISRWAILEPAVARDEVRRWSASDEYIFGRLRIWAAGQPWLTAEQSAAIFSVLPDRMFWGSFHERDLLYSLRDRWADLPADARCSLEHRLRTGAYPWSSDVEGGVERAVAYDRLSRLHWLSTNGVVFSFDVAAEMRALRVAAPEWTTRAGDSAADSHDPTVYGVLTDESADPLLNTPISDILTEAQEAGRQDFFERVQREPFRGLSKHRPVRALGALTHVGRKGEAPRSAWSAFLYADTRPVDSLRMIRVIARRLTRLPITQFKAIAYPISEWMLAIAARLYGDASAELDPLWRRIIEALTLSDEGHERPPGRSWADDALNAPVGKLYDLLMKDPTKDHLSRGAAFPARWTAKVEQLLGLPGEHRGHALVMFSHQVTWLYHIAPAWTERVLLPSADVDGDDGEAFWDGVLWAARNPHGALFKRLRSGLTARARHPQSRHAHGNVIAAFLLSAWLFGAESQNAEGALSDDELREVLIHADDQLRGQFIWHLEQLLEAEGGKFRGRIIPFLRNVWPKQRALRTPPISAKLTNFALASGDLMPEVVELILPRLVPVRVPTLRMALAKDGTDHYPARQHPRTTLDLLWAVLGEDPKQWPYKIEDALDELAKAVETRGDPRLSELRRRRER